MGLRRGREAGFSTRSAASLEEEVLVRVLMDEAFPEGEEEDLQIEQERPVLDVIEVEFNSLFHAGIAAPPMDLGPAGDPGFYFVTEHILWDVLGELLHKDGPLRAGSNDTHIPL